MATKSSATSSNDGRDEYATRLIDDDDSSVGEALDIASNDDTSVGSSFTTVDDEQYVHTRTTAAGEGSDSSSACFDDCSSDHDALYFDAETSSCSVPSYNAAYNHSSTLRDHLIGDSELEVHHGLGLFRVKFFTRPVKPAQQARRSRQVRREIEETEVLFAPAKKQKVDFEMRW